MSDIAKLEIGNESYEFPLIKGTENEVAINIKTLRGATNGVITIDPGFKNTGSCESAITFLDGEKGILRYRGYTIEELAEKADFLETAYALIFGDLPTNEQLDKFHEDIKSNSVVDEDVKKIIDAFPKNAHPMGVLSSLTSALVAFNPSAVNVESEDDMYNSIVKIMGKFPVLVAWAMRKKSGLPLNYLNHMDLKEHILTLAKKYFKSTEIIENISNFQVFLNKDKIESLGFTKDEVTNKLVEELVYYKDLYKVVSAKTLQTTSFNNGVLQSLQNGYNQKYSGDICMIPYPATLGGGRTGTSHGSGYNYDTHIPVLFYGKGIQKGTSKKRYNITDIAPTISNLLEIEAPNASTGKIIDEAIQ